ncbi:hypothetical protein ACFWCB_07785 [Streptomyces sp. NPDC060048]|uniref:hypothetical protein n=1 Tax=unclassified Streptomyces TaxID=2593676 RepID=UPI00367A9F7D
MVLFSLLLTAAIVLIIIGATVDGMLYLVTAGVLLLIADVLHLAVRSVLRRRRQAADPPATVSATAPRPQSLSGTRTAAIGTMTHFG